MKNVIYTLVLMVVLLIVFIYEYENILFNDITQEKNYTNNNNRKSDLNYHIGYNAQYDPVLDLLDDKYDKCSYTLKKCLLDIEGRKKIFRKRTASVKYLLPFPINIKNSVESTHICRDNMELIIGINSSPNSYLERYTYRKIYNEYNNDVEYYFFVGMSTNETINELIKEENEKYNDIIQFDFISHYYNLTYQTIGCLRWLNEHCKSYKYIVEHQSDVFFNIIYYFQVFGIKNEIYQVISSAYTNRGPIRETSSIFYKRWEVPKSIYPYNKYPDYPQGPCILFSEYAANRICESSYSYNFVLFLDDVYLGLLMNNTGIKQYSVGNKIRNSVNRIKNVNEIKTNILWLHGVQPGFMYHIWKLIR